jgi:hypothetical protein
MSFGLISGRTFQRPLDQRDGIPSTTGDDVGEKVSGQIEVGKGARRENMHLLTLRITQDLYRLS